MPKPDPVDTAAMRAQLDAAVAGAAKQRKIEEAITHLRGGIVEVAAKRMKSLTVPVVVDGVKLLLVVERDRRHAPDCVVNTYDPWDPRERGLECSCGADAP